VKACEDLSTAQTRTRARVVSAGTTLEVERERVRAQWADRTLRRFESLDDLRSAAARELARLNCVSAPVRTPLGLTRSAQQLAFEPLDSLAEFRLRTRRCDEGELPASQVITRPAASPILEPGLAERSLPEVVPAPVRPT